MFKSIKVACIFVGTYIGAGFATGREIVVFFGNSSPIILIFSCLISAILAMLFLILGSEFKSIVPTKGGKVMLTAFALATFVVYSAMLAGSNEIVGRGSTIIAIIVVIICTISKQGLTILNVAVIPFVLLLLIILATRLEIGIYEKGLFVQNAFAYSALNIFLGGFLIVPQGRTMPKKQVYLSGIIIFFLLCVLSLIVYFAVQTAIYSPMPLLQVASNLGLRQVAIVIIELAIITTMAGCFTALNGILGAISDGKWLNAGIILFLGLGFMNFGFENLVNYGYPIVSIVGLLYTISVLATFLINRKPKQSIPLLN